MKPVLKLFPLLLLSLVLVRPALADSHGSLPSWRDTATRATLVTFVARVTDPDSEAFVPPAERIAVFDNDGTLWAEQPVYFQALFAVSRVRAMAPEQRDWQTTEPFASALKGELPKDREGFSKLMLATHGHQTEEVFARATREWLESARHPATGRAYTDMVYQPMLELLHYLRSHGFSTWIVSGGGQQFIRAWSEDVYGIPPEQVVGTSLGIQYEVRNGTPLLIQQPTVDFINDGPGKPVGILRHIGRRPILAVGNSDGDFQMLEYTTAGDGARLGVLLHHTDSEREWAYDRDSHVGALERGLDESGDRGWLLIDMKRDWSEVFPPSDAKPAAAATR